jgi:hypothetical protein
LQINYADSYDDYDDGPEQIFAIREVPPAPPRVATVQDSQWILMDSGSDVHICNSQFAPWSQVRATGHQPNLEDVQGGSLSTKGTKEVKLRVGSQGHRTSTEFLVSDSVKGAVFSLGRLLRKGYRFELDLGAGRLNMTSPQGQNTDLSLLRNSLYMRAEVMKVADRTPLTPEATQKAANQSFCKPCQVRAASSSESLEEVVTAEDLDETEPYTDCGEPANRRCLHWPLCTAHTDYHALWVERRRKRAFEKLECTKTTRQREAQGLPSLQGLAVWSMTSAGARVFRTTTKDGPLWCQVHRRVTKDLATDLVIEDIDPRGLSDQELHKPIPGGPLDTETLLYYDPSQKAKPTRSSSSLSQDCVRPLVAPQPPVKAEPEEVPGADAAMEAEAERQHYATVTDTDLPVTLDGEMLTSQSTVRLMKAKLKQYNAPVYGSKEQLWTRLQEHARIATRDEEIRQALDDREKQSALAPAVIPGVEPPTDEERALHNLTHPTGLSTLIF